jgi:undecaprenyl diphosphate synthase
MSFVKKFWHKLFSIHKEENIQELCSKMHHLAFIIDGDRRWAKKHGWTVKDVYQKMNEQLLPIIDFSLKAEVPILTIWFSSTSNIVNRPKDQMAIFHEECAKLCDLIRDMMIKEKCRVVHVGQKTRIPEDLRKSLENIEADTKHFNAHIFNLGIDYGGQDEIVRATKRIVEKGLTSDQITREVFEQNTDFGGQPYPSPDLIIRTGGETRLSGFMSWQLEYCEICFYDKFFPDFTVDDLKNIIRKFNLKERRFGGGR